MKLFIVCLFLITSSAHAASLYSNDGTYLGNVNNNPYDPNSISNPYGKYGSPYSPDSINNPYGQYGDPYGADSMANPYTIPKMPTMPSMPSMPGIGMDTFE